MKFRERNRPSATFVHSSVSITLGSALPLAISSSRPFLSMGARQPVRAVLVTAWFMSFLSCSWFKIRYRPFCTMQEACHLCARQKVERNQKSLGNRGNLASQFSLKRRSSCLSSGRCFLSWWAPRADTERSFHFPIAVVV